MSPVRPSPSTWRLHHHGQNALTECPFGTRCHCSGVVSLEDALIASLARGLSWFEAFRGSAGNQMRPRTSIFLPFAAQNSKSTNLHHHRSVSILRNRASSLWLIPPPTPLAVASREQDLQRY